MCVCVREREGRKCGRPKRGRYRKKRERETERGRWLIMGKGDRGKVREGVGEI